MQELKAMLLNIKPLSLAATQLTSGSIPNARVPASNVTQHQASLTIGKTQVTDFDFFARSAVTGTARNFQKPLHMSVQFMLT